MPILILPLPFITRSTGFNPPSGKFSGDLRFFLSQGFTLYELRKLLNQKRNRSAYLTFLSQTVVPTEQSKFVFTRKNIVLSVLIFFSFTCDALGLRVLLSALNTLRNSFSPLPPPPPTLQWIEPYRPRFHEQGGLAVLFFDFGLFAVNQFFSVSQKSAYGLFGSCNMCLFRLL